MTILGIETSCDETAAAIVEDGTKMVTSVVASSQEIHAKYGGIIPDKAAREQLKSILPVVEEATQGQNFDAIAVTVGPGLVGSLLVGVETAKTLAYSFNKPLIPVNHLVGHIYANWLDSGAAQNDAPRFPAVVLIVSGGHTELVLMKDHGKFGWLGGTRDDAAGECFDKSARLLGLGYPGGPAIELAARKFQTLNSKSQIKLPRPMINEKNLDFSFSGLKTAVANVAGNKNQIAYELQEAIVEVLTTKTLRAAEKFGAKSVLLAGGVAANKQLRTKFERDDRVHIPPIKLCTDNAACIASAAYFNYVPAPFERVSVDPGLDFF